MINILFITQTAVKPEHGGVQRVTYTLANDFARIGARVFFVAVKGTAKSDEIDPRQVFFPDVSQLVTSQNLKFFEEFVRANDIDYIINQIGIFPEINSFLRRVDRGRARLISVHHNCVCCLNERYREIILGNFRGSLFWRTVDMPLVWRFLRALNRLRYGRLFKKAVFSADKFVVLSRRFIPEMKFYGVAATDKVVAIENPIPFAISENSTAKEKRVLFVGRLRFTQKRVDKLMEIWRCLHDEFPDWWFDVVGEGEARGWMEQFASRHQMERVRFHGYADPRPYLERASILTSTSDFEGFHLVLAEAQAFGVVPVAYQCFSGIEDIIEDGVSGILVHDFSIESYVDALRRLMGGSAEKLAMVGAAAKDSVARRTGDAIVAEWMRLFRSIDYDA